MITSRQTIANTDFLLPNQEGVYHGKVRDVHDFGRSLMLVATDRYSAFDRNLALVQHKGELVTAISRWWFDQTESMIKNHIISYPDPNVAWCNKYTVVPIEVIVRGYITGVTNTSLWHNYSKGQRNFGEFTLPEGLRKNQKLNEPVLTPTTKFEKHDRPLTPQEAVNEGLTDADVWEEIKQVALDLFLFGQKTAETKGLILVDTKYEFGLDEQNNLVLIDELHTPDSSGYWLASTYQQMLDEDKEPENYDKEYLRLWLKARLDPYKDSIAPTVPDAVCDELTNRYIHVYESLTGQKFVPATSSDPIGRIESNLKKALSSS